MEQNRKSVHRYIDEVVGAKKVYILILLLIQAALGVSSVLYALFLRDIVDGAVAHDFLVMVRSMCAFAGLVVCQLALRALSRHISELACSTYENAFKSRLFGELLSRDFGSVTAIHSGEWMNRLTSDTAVVADGLASIVPGVAGAAVRIVGALTMILVIEARFAYILIPGGAVFAALTYVFRRHLKRLHKSVQERDGEVRVFLQEHLGSLMIVKAFAKERETESVAEQRMSAHKSARMKRNRFSNICNIGFGAVMNGAYVLGALYSAFGIYSGSVSYGTLMALLQLIGQVQSPFANITGYLPKYYAMLASAERLMDVERFAADDAADPTQACEPFTRLGLKSASFSYVPESDGKHSPIVIKNFDFEIKTGEFVAFTGPSGCGKSTVLKLLMCLYALDGGERYYVTEGASGEEYHDLTAAMRPIFSYVPQGNQLMSGKIRNVVAFTDGGAANDDDAVWNALRVACAEEFVRTLPLGLDTVLGERGSGLSEGQMQRIAIARAVFSGRPVLLLDEATSALDAPTEKQLLANLRAMTDKTVIIITHRAETAAVCDREVKFG